MLLLFPAASSCGVTQYLPCASLTGVRARHGKPCGRWECCASWRSHIMTPSAALWVFWRGLVSLATATTTFPARLSFVLAAFRGSLARRQFARLLSAQELESAAPSRFRGSPIARGPPRLQHRQFQRPSTAAGRSPGCAATAVQSPSSAAAAAQHGFQRLCHCTGRCSRSSGGSSSSGGRPGRGAVAQRSVFERRLFRGRDRGGSGAGAARRRPPLLCRPRGHPRLLQRRKGVLWLGGGSCAANAVPATRRACAGLALAGTGRGDHWLGAAPCLPAFSTSTDQKRAP